MSKKIEEVYPHLTKDFLEDEYFVKNKTTAQIAKENDVSGTAIRSLFKRFKIETLTQSKIMKQRYEFGDKPWNKGLTQETDERVKNNIEKSTNSIIETFKNGRVTWNKNKINIYSEEALEKMRLARLGKPSQHKEDCICPFCSSLFGKNNNFYGKKHTKETSRKMSITRGGTGEIQDRKLYPNYFLSIRETIRKRDNYNCQLCPKHQDDNDRALDIHHIDYDETNNEHSNLISLCHSCHPKTNVNREYWQSYFTALQISRNIYKGK